MKLLISICLFVFLVLFHQMLWSQCRLDKSQYELVLHEDFSKYSGSVDKLLGPKSIWKAIPDEGVAHGWGTEYYDPQQIQLLKNEQGLDFLRLTAQSLETPVTFSNGRTAYYKSGMLMLKSRNQLHKFDHAFDEQIEGCYRDSRGYRYGMFEIRCKLPSTSRHVKDSWPAFWLISVDSEIDIIDNMHANNAQIYDSYINDWVKLPWSPYNTQWKEVAYCADCPEFQLDKNYQPGDVISVNWGKSYENILNSTPLACHQVYLSPHHDFTNYTTYTCVWTPDKVTFFIDGVEVYTVPDSLVRIMTYCPMTMLLTLQTMGTVPSDEGSQEFYFDIEDIKVYKARDGVDMNDFKSTYAYKVHDLTRGQPRVKSQSVHNSVQNITSLKNDIIYKSDSKHLMMCSKVNGSWVSTAVRDGRKKISLSSGIVTHPNGETVCFWDKKGSFWTGKFKNGQWVGKANVVKDVQNRKQLKLKKGHEIFQVTDYGEVFFVTESDELYSFNSNSDAFLAQRIASFHSQGQYNFVVNNNILICATNDRLMSIFALNESGNWLLQTTVNLNIKELSKDIFSLQFVEFLNKYLIKTIDGVIHFMDFENGQYHIKELKGHHTTSIPLNHIGASTVTVDDSLQSLFYINEGGRLVQLQYLPVNDSWIREYIYPSRINNQFLGYRNQQDKYTPNFVYPAKSLENINYVYANQDGRLTVVNYGLCENALESCYDQPSDYYIHTINKQP